MAIIWIEAKPRTVFEALDAIEQAVDYQRQLAQLDERFMEDTYLAANATYNLANTAATGGTYTGFGQGTGSINIGGGNFN